MSIATEPIRQRAIAAHLAGQTQSQVAKCYGIHLATFQRWLKRHRETGQTAPLPRGHNPAALDEQEMLRLNQLVRATPDATQPDMEPTRLVFIDESGAKTNMTWRCGE
jgi:transposase